MIPNSANNINDIHLSNYNNQYGNFGIPNGNSNTHEPLTNGTNEFSNLTTINTFQSK